MAAPHITGLAALVLAHHPDFQGAWRTRSAERVERLFQTIKMSARKVSLGDQYRTGLGLADALVALGLQAHAQPGQIGGIMSSLLPQQAIGGIGGRGGQLDLYGMDPALAAFAGISAGNYPQQLQRFGQFAGMPFTVGAPVYRGVW
ncbi:hypothetical protein HHL21_01245 [Massilia sp. RP-1-19]|uniref:Peptidase S8/S53 domain-containing protein n=1 Tax=Massilia polaris TaxID=2728846 RepID=A0A848HD44_9BURK|nr:hypothetical protein [Massilia polaris]NML59736.1 hypothetical protein [Massilia polaris]